MPQDGDPLLGAEIDSTTLDAIAADLDGTDWSSDTLDRIADLVRGTGRAIRDLSDPEPALPDRTAALLRGRAAPPTPAVIVILPGPDARGDCPAVSVSGFEADVLLVDPPEWYCADEAENRELALDAARGWLDFLTEHAVDPASGGASDVAYKVAELLEGIEATWPDLGPAYQAWRDAAPASR